MGSFFSIEGTMFLFCVFFGDKFRGSQPSFPLSPAGNPQRRRMARSFEAPTACEPKPARRSSAQSLTRNLSQIALAQAPQLGAVFLGGFVRLNVNPG